MTPAASIPVVRSRVLDYMELGKPRITMMVALTAAGGYLFGLAGPLDGAHLAWTLIGTALASMGAAALNMVWERDIDALMRRTADRPVAAGRLHPHEALAWGALMTIAGVALLASLVHFLAAALAAASVLIYVFAYTPMKRATTVSTVVGGVSGALPPVIGWAAATGAVDAVAASLFAILFMWQLPHFLAIGWMTREDCARAKLPTLAVLDPTGASTARQMIVQTLGLIVASWAPVAMGRAGMVYGAAALLLGAAFLASIIPFAVKRTDAWARRAFRASLLYLPLLLAVLALDRR